MISPVWIIGFSGHRQLTPVQAETVRQALQSVFAELRQTAAGLGGTCELFTSLAYGTDQLAVQVADETQMPVHLILPKLLTDDQGIPIPEGFASDFQEEGRGQADALAFAIRRTAEAKAGRGGGSCRQSSYTDHAPECYYDTGLQILDGSDILVAVWNGQAAAGLGGTAQWCAQARRRSLPLIIIHPDGGMTRENMEQFKSDAGLEIVQRIAAAALAEPCDQREEKPSEQLFRRLDNAGTRLGKEFRNHLVRSILLHGAATAIAAVAAVIPFHIPPWIYWLILLALVESGILIWLTWRNIRVHRGHVHETWIETRFAAEILRSQIPSGPLLDPLHPIISQHHHIEWRRLALATGLLIHREQSPGKTFRERQRDYLDQRLLCPDPNRGQIAHYQEQQVRAQARFGRFLFWGRFSTAAATVVVILALLYKLSELSGTHWEAPWQMTVLTILFFTLFPVLLPLAGGVFLSLRSALDTGRRTYRYRQLVQRLVTAADAIAALETPASVRRAVTLTEDMLLDELIEWRLTEQQNGGH